MDYVNKNYLVINTAEIKKINRTDSMLIGNATVLKTIPDFIVS